MMSEDQFEMVESGDSQLDELLGSEFGVRQLLASFPDYVTCLDLDGRIVLVNRVSTELDGVPVVGVDSSLFVPPLRRREYVLLCRRVVESRTTETFEFTSTRSLLRYRSRLAPLCTPEGKVLGIVSTTSDVTELRRAMRRADDALRVEREATRKLRDLDELKNEFVAKVAHDLRTPITTVQGFADTMLFRWSEFDDDEKLRFLDLISQGTRQLMVLVEDILQVANIESAEFQVELDDIPLHRPLEMLAEQFAVITPRGRIDWSVPDTLPLVRADEQRMIQVVTNLVSNALKFSEPDTVVRVSAQAAQASDTVRLRVEDEGIGIAQKDLSRLFGKFVQVDQSRTGRATPPGSGLGLYITQSLVEAMGGDVWIESTVGVGTTVVVELQVAES
jgi:signal transduction histidine kinase